MPQDDEAGTGPVFSLDEVVDLERYAEHRNGSGKVDYVYDGINFWCGDQGRSCPFSPLEELPREGWRHKATCRCPHCREARARRRKRGRPR